MLFDICIASYEWTLLFAYISFHLKTVDTG